MKRTVHFVHDKNCNIFNAELFDKKRHSTLLHTHMANHKVNMKSQQNSLQFQDVEKLLIKILECF